MIKIAKWRKDGFPLEYESCEKMNDDEVYLFIAKRRISNRIIGDPTMSFNVERESTKKVSDAINERLSNVEVPMEARKNAAAVLSIYYPDVELIHGPDSEMPYARVSLEVNAIFEDARWANLISKDDYQKLAWTTE